MACLNPYRPAGTIKTIRGFHRIAVIEFSPAFQDREGNWKIQWNPSSRSDG